MHASRVCGAEDSSFTRPTAVKPDTGEHENPEGFVVRVRFPGNPVPRKMASARGSTAAAVATAPIATRAKACPRSDQGA